MSFINTSFNVVFSFFTNTLDVTLFAFILYQTYKVLYQAKSLQIANGLLFFLFLYLLSYLLNLQLLLWMFNHIFSYFIIIVIILYQNEIKQLLINLNIDFLPFLSQKKNVSDPYKIREVVRAASFLSSKKKGALICFTEESEIKDYVKLGVSLQAEITSELLISIFEYKTPLHDGSILIEDNKITYASCILPLSHQEDISQHFGTRHRAALGLTEVTNSIAVIISEETGAISLSYKGKLDYNMDSEDLFDKLNFFLSKTREKP